jgi:hypothetical protein
MSKQDSVHFDGNLEDFTGINFEKDDSDSHFSDHKKGIEERLKEFKGDHYFKVSLWRLVYVCGEMRPTNVNQFSNVLQTKKIQTCDELVAFTYLFNDGDCIRIGRRRENEFRPKSNYVSRKHCLVLLKNTAEGTKLFYRDVGTFNDGSTNGTFVNGYKDKRVPFPDFSKPPFEWNINDCLEFGNTICDFPGDNDRMVHEFLLKYEKIANKKSEK